MSEKVVIVDVDELKRLELLRDIVRIALDPGVWTDAHAEALFRLTGKREIEYTEIYEMAKGADCERY
jgi:hypothetical protein